jgi:hypothetical protein
MKWTESLNFDARKTFMVLLVNIVSLATLLPIHYPFVVIWLHSLAKCKEPSVQEVSATLILLCLFQVSGDSTYQILLSATHSALTALVKVGLDAQSFLLASLLNHAWEQTGVQFNTGASVAKIAQIASTEPMACALSAQILHGPLLSSS